MKLYPKKLRSIDDLEKEKVRLEKKSRELEKEEFLSVEGLLKGKKGKDGGGSLPDFLAGVSPVVSVLAKIIKRRLSKKDKILKINIS